MTQARNQPCESRVQVMTRTPFGEREGAFVQWPALSYNLEQ
jgi:hypothetical protein